MIPCHCVNARLQVYFTVLVCCAPCSYILLWHPILGDSVVIKKADEPPVIISAIATVVTVAEILKNNGLAVEKSKILVT